MATFPLTPTLPVILRGKYWSVPIQNYHSKPTTLDVSTFTWTAHLSATPGGTPIVSLTVDSSTAAAGFIGLSLDAAATGALTEGSVVWVGVNVTISANTTQVVRSSTRVEDPA